MQAVERQLSEAVDGRALDGDAQADEGVVDDVPPVPLLRVLAWTFDCQGPHVGHVLEGVDEAGHVGGGVEQRRVLLRQDLAELRVGVLWAGQHRRHGCVRSVEEVDLGACVRVDQGRQEGRFRMREVEGEMFDMVADAGQGLYSRMLGEGAGCKGDLGAPEESFCNKVAEGRRGEADVGDI